MPNWPCSFPILWGESALIDHESDRSYSPYIRIELTKTGSTTYNYYLDRILSIDIHQDPVRDDGTIILTNHDQHLKNINLQGYQVKVYFGLTIDGVNYTNAIAPQWVMAQSFTSQEGKLVCKLTTKGILSSLKDDKSGGFYTGEGKAKSIIDRILKSGLSCYSHCTAWDVVWHGDTGLDGINIYAPSDAFNIALNTSRLDAVNQLLDLDISYMRPEADGKIHIRRPKLSGTDYDHQFALDGHTFFWHERHNDLLIPNYVDVLCETETPPPYSEPRTYRGYAQDDASFGDYPVKYFQRAYDLTSDQEAMDIAEGILSNIRQNQTLGSAEVQMSFYSQIGDYIKITDVREGSERICNIGSIDWHYSAGKYRQTLGIGGWWNRRKAMGFMQDKVEQPIKREFPYWMFATLPATKLLAGQYILFQVFRIPHYRRLFVKHWSICGGGRLVFGIWDGSAFSWKYEFDNPYPPPDTLPYLAANAYWTGTPKEILDSFDIGGTPFAFAVESPWGVEMVTASVGFDIQYLGGSMP